MPSLKAPAAAARRTATTLTVAAKCRPIARRDYGRDIIRVSDRKEVLVLDPDLSKDYLDRIQNRTKEKKYCFDHAFGPDCSNRDVYRRCIASTIAGVVQGLNATVFAYGSTGSGKTYTMVGTKNDPGLMVLSLHTIFHLIKQDTSSDEFEVNCSYLEVYNEVIFDLLEKSSGHLELREDPVKGIVVAGLKSIKVNSADKILELLNLGNSRRKTESTEANATSSRSHAVLEIIVKRKQKNKYRNQVMQGKLALVDLAGSERASETNNGGQKLRDGANINRSLLALANCINALGKQQKKGLAYVPYRNSKLTRILKDGLSGNSQTVMVATISPADSQYHHTVNTLKYADRAKEIKTHIQKNIGTIDTHVSDYQRMIDSLQIEVCRLKKELAEKESQLNVRPTDKVADDELSWLNLLSQETSENVQERINLQKAMFELEEINLRNRAELRHLDDAIAKQQVIEKDGPVVEALRARRQVILDNIRDNDEAGFNYQKGMSNTELQFEIAMRDQVIHNQREAQRNLWNLVMGLGLESLDKKRLLDVAAWQGIPIEDYMMTPYLGLSDNSHLENVASHRYLPFGSSPCMGRSLSKSSCNLHHHQFFCSGPTSSGNWSALCREEHHSSYYLLSHDVSQSTHLRSCKTPEHCGCHKPRSRLGTPDVYHQGSCRPSPEVTCEPSHFQSRLSSGVTFGRQHESSFSRGSGIATSGQHFYEDRDGNRSKQESYVLNHSSRNQVFLPRSSLAQSSRMERRDDLIKTDPKLR
ncbi:kinesin-like protein KIN-8B isoform X2 [Syzygium oleosum]|uniref:kinesin-like protein KIN-8B isoform X2 n=1 Tax=Syzygium oleosum TaxID=219896 RepID=UPI0024B93B6C|nr:kinesin-like protein KIN-8B isoform X2 [Syzygium oleosum]